MEVIVEAKKKIAKIWGKQKIKDSEYRMMKYVIPVEIENGLLLHNTVTRQLVFLSREEAEELKSIQNSKTDLLRGLIEDHFLVPECFDEYKSVNQLRNLLNRLEAKKYINSFTILPTTSCNARCFYCYEAGCEHHTLTSEMCEKIVDFIESHRDPKNKVTLHWFGGEPLVGWQKIDDICERLIEKNIDFNSTMISNGYLFTEKLVKMAKEKWNLVNVQITLDGTEDIYNKVKAYVYTEGSPYKKVLFNIESLLNQGIHVSVRMNMDRHNAENLKELIQELSDQFKENKYFSAYVATLFDDEGFDPVRHTATDHIELFNKQIELEKELISNEMHIKKNKLPVLKQKSCMADSDASILINPLGQLGKCEHDFSVHLVGDVDTGITNKEEVSNWKLTKEQDECKDCPLYPTCYKLSRCDTAKKCNSLIMTHELNKYKESIIHHYESNNR